MNKQVLLVFSAIILFGGFLLMDSAAEAAPMSQWQEIVKQQDMVVVVEKSINTMTVFYQGKAVKRFLCVSGVNSQGDKQRQGDNRTPEGIFFIIDKELLHDDPYLGRKWIGLSYPDPVHAQKGIEQKLISVSQYQEIILANEQKVQPPQDTALGGWIGIHGGRDDLTERKINWTEGCVALQDDDLTELYKMVQYGTTVIIVA